jgi:glycosyltransferase involved in cell wall biosynthesis
MSSPSPVVSVVIPTRNRAKELAVRVREMAAQTLEDHEVVIVDDGSSDETPAVARAAAAEDDRVRYVRVDPPVGMPGVLQRCLDEARSDLVSIFHDHDEYCANILERLLVALRSSPEAAFAFCGITLVGSNAAEEVHLHPPGFGQRQDVLTAFVRNGACPVCASATMVRKHRLPTPAFDPRLGLFADVRLWCQLSATSPSGYVREPLVRVQGWDEGEGLRKHNWEIIGSLARLRRELATTIAPGPGRFLLLRLRIFASCMRERVRFIARLIRHALRGNPLPEPALRGLPRPVAWPIRRLDPGKQEG